MASPSEVTACWVVIEAAGIPRPWKTAEEVDRASQVWAAVLADVPAQRLAELTTAWLRSPDARYRTWPMPGALLHALPDPATIDDADDAWAEALTMIRQWGADRCPSTAEALDDLRIRLRAGIREARQLAENAARDRKPSEVARQQAREQRFLALGSRLPRADAARDAALIAGVNACGGWRSLGRAEEDAITAHRASFRAAYRGHRQRRQLNATEAAVVALLDGPPSTRRLTGES